MAREFNRMLDRIGHDEERRSQLLSAISHELRTRPRWPVDTSSCWRRWVRIPDRRLSTRPAWRGRSWTVSVGSSTTLRRHSGGHGLRYRERAGVRSRRLGSPSPQDGWPGTRGGHDRARTARLSFPIDQAD
jgi:hypothetical protein